MNATSLRSRAAIARQPAITLTRIGSRVAAGQRITIAITDAPAAMPQPAIRSGICPAVPGSETGRMYASSSGVVALAITELTTAENSTTKATIAMPTTAIQVVRDASVPSEISPMQVTPSSTCDRTRSTIGPVKSTNSNIANEPNAANVATSGLPITLTPSASIAGMISAVRPARRSAP